MGGRVKEKATPPAPSGVTIPEKRRDREGSPKHLIEKLKDETRRKP